MTEQESIHSLAATINSTHPDVFTELVQTPAQGYIPDPYRVFYHSKGHFHGDYSDVVVDTKNRVVTVIWAAGHRRELRGDDAYRFLKLNRSRHAGHFQPRTRN